MLQKQLLAEHHGSPIQDALMNAPVFLQESTALPSTLACYLQNETDLTAIRETRHLSFLSIVLPSTLPFLRSTNHPVDHEMMMKKEDGLGFQWEVVCVNEERMSEVARAFCARSGVEDVYAFVENVISACQSVCINNEFDNDNDNDEYFCNRLLSGDHYSLS